MLAGASPILHAARANAPSETGLLKKSIKVRVIRKKHRSQPTLVLIGPTNMKRPFRKMTKGKNAGSLRGVGKKGLVKAYARGDTIVWRNPGKYGHLVELGRAALKTPTKKGKKFLVGYGAVIGRHAKAVPPRPFMRPAFEAHKAGSLRRITAKLWKGIQEELRKQAKGRV
jgi:hypothetical protein